jgi:hypothetical protein
MFRAFGVVDPAKAEAMGRGWNELVGARLKALVETGRRAGIDGNGPTNVHAIEETPGGRGDSEEEPLTGTAE